MDFATKWLEEKALFPELFVQKPDSNTGIIVVIPSYNEPGIIEVLNSLASCRPPSCRAEVIVIFNLKQDADVQAVMTNRKGVEDCDTWKKENPGCFFRLLVFDAGKPAFKKWGVGMARKTGMDEAVRRFNAVNNPEGVILSLDADCKVKPDYFVSVEKSLLLNKRHTACSIYFEHPLEGEETNKTVYEHILFYELHLRYYIQALKFSGFPYAYHTVGSAMAVKAYEYIRAGGMNRRQAGEDFYFIQKLVGSGGFFALNSTTVFPSPRESLRVPFGTGATISRMVKKEETELLTYNFVAFRDLAELFGPAPGLFRCSNTFSENFFNELPLSLRSFISLTEWISVIEKINLNTSSAISFTKRFFGWFNMFRIVRYLNNVHESIYQRQPVTKAACDFLRSSGHKSVSEEPARLLEYFRMLDKNT